MVAAIAIGFLVASAVVLLFFLSYVDSEHRLERRMAWAGVAVACVVVVLILAVALGPSY